MPNKIVNGSIKAYRKPRIAHVAANVAKTAPAKIIITTVPQSEGIFLDSISQAHDREGVVILLAFLIHPPAPFPRVSGRPYHRNGLAQNHEAVELPVSVVVSPGVHSSGLWLLNALNDGKTGAFWNQSSTSAARTFLVISSTVDFLAFPLLPFSNDGSMDGGPAVYMSGTPRGKISSHSAQERTGSAPFRKHTHAVPVWFVIPALSSW